LATLGIVLVVLGAVVASGVIVALVTLALAWVLRMSLTAEAERDRRAKVGKGEGSIVLLPLSLDVIGAVVRGIEHGGRGPRLAVLGPQPIGNSCSRVSSTWSAPAPRSAAAS
jgi:hypothetical protein